MTRITLRSALDGLVGQAAIYVLAAVVNAALPFMLLPLIARWLGPSDFGVIGSFSAIVNVLVLLVGLNAYGFVSVGYFREGPLMLARLTGAAIAIVVMAAVVVGVAGWIEAETIERFTGIDSAWLWTLLAAATGQAILAVGLTVAQTLRRPFVYGAFQIGYGVLLAIFAVTLVGAFDMGWPGRAMAQAIAAVMVALGILAWLHVSGRVTTAVDRKTMGSALRFGMPLLPHSFAAVAMGSMDRLALGGSFSPAVVGQYFLALQLASAFTAFASAVNQSWVPWLYERLKRNDATAWMEIARAIQIGGGLLIAAVVAMVLLATPLVLVAGGNSYLPATTPLRLLAGYAGCQAWYTLMSAFLFYADRPRLLSILTVSTALGQGCLIAFFLRWGATGIAGALLVSALLAAIAISVVAFRLAARHRAAFRSSTGPASTMS